MVQIIPDKSIIRNCDICHSKLIYQMKDVKYRENGITPSYIDCPNCEAKVPLLWKK